MEPRSLRWTVAAGAAAVGLAAGLAVPALAGSDAPEALPRVAFVARNDVPFDALAVGPVAGALGAVTVITPSDALSAPAETALQDFAPDRVYLVGGSGALSDDVEAAVEAADDGDPSLDWTVERVFGTTRDGTAQALAALPAALGYDRPILLDQGGDLPLMWGDAYSLDSHDHGINAGAAGDAARTGGVADGTEAGPVTVGAGTEVVSELTVVSAQLDSNCPVGTPLHNFLVESSGTVRTNGAAGDVVARLSTTLDSTVWPSPVDVDGDETATTLSRLGAPDDAASFATHHLFTVTPDADRTFRLLAERDSGTASFEVEIGTLVVQHLGYECSP